MSFTGNFHPVDASMILDDLALRINMLNDETQLSLIITIAKNRMMALDNRGQYKEWLTQQ